MTKENEKVNPDIINPIDWFNDNHVQYVMNIMCSKPLAEITGINSFSYTKSKPDKKKQMIVIENDKFVAKMENDLGMEINVPYSPFRMLVEFKFKCNWQRAVWHIVYDLMNIEIPYIRVGTKYFKIISKTDRNGIKRTSLKLWDKITIIDDYGKSYLDRIAGYNDFTIIPNNKGYSSAIGNNYNLYTPFEHEPIDKNEYKEDGWVWTKNLLQHIFGNQYELGLQYVKVLYDHPTQKLPILVLTSDERSTGKTTFIDWIEMLFGDNTVIINPQDIGNNFNSAYADKNIVMIEESRFESVQATEKLKNLATQKKILVNTKFIAQYSIPFHGKLIITSNDENKFSRVDNSEIRYWVRKVPTLVGKANHGILNDLRNEIPHFLYYLDTLEPVDLTKSRMVFDAEAIKTQALLRVKEESLPSLMKEIKLLFEAHGEENPDVEEFLFIAKDVKERWFKNNHRVEINYINKILIDMNIERKKMMKYYPIEDNYVRSRPKKSGRPFFIKNPNYGEEESKSTVFTEDILKPKK